MSTATKETTYTVVPVTQDEWAFVNAYLDCALWATTDDSRADPNTGCGPNLDENFFRSDFSPEALDEIYSDCVAFFRAHRELITGEAYTGSAQYDPVEYAGHDFFLTRNHHGAGFWDGDWDGGDGEGGKTLTDAAHVYGNSEPYVGDDGKLYLSH